MKGEAAAEGVRGVGCLRIGYWREVREERKGCFGNEDKGREMIGGVRIRFATGDGESVEALVSPVGGCKRSICIVKN